LNWIRERCEVHRPALAKEAKLGLLSRLAHAELFESLLATKFNTAKRFGVEGLESIIPGMLAMVETAAEVCFISILI
jgi:2-oxoglutarate dehydrogenase E1 component